MTLTISSSKLALIVFCHKISLRICWRLGSIWFSWTPWRLSSPKFASLNWISQCSLPWNVIWNCQNCFNSIPSVTSWKFKLHFWSRTQFKPDMSQLKHKTWLPSSTTVFKLTFDQNNPSLQQNHPNALYSWATNTTSGPLLFKTSKSSKNTHKHQPSFPMNSKSPSFKTFLFHKITLILWLTLSNSLHLKAQISNKKFNLSKSTPHQNYPPNLKRSFTSATTWRAVTFKTSTPSPHNAQTIRLITTVSTTSTKPKFSTTSLITPSPYPLKCGDPSAKTTMFSVLALSSSSPMI